MKQDKTSKSSAASSRPNALGVDPELFCAYSDEVFERLNTLIRMDDLVRHAVRNTAHDTEDGRVIDRQLLMEHQLKQIRQADTMAEKIIAPSAFSDEDTVAILESIREFLSRLGRPIVEIDGKKAASAHDLGILVLRESISMWNEFRSYANGKSKSSLPIWYWIDFMDKQPVLDDIALRMQREAAEIRIELAKPQPANDETTRGEPVRKPDGWTRAELIEQVNKDIHLSETTFDRIRNAAGVKSSERGGKGQQRRYSNAELRKLIDEVDSGSTKYRHREKIAKAWKELLPE